jgi:4-oxalocrotonate tautomerase
MIMSLGIGEKPMPHVIVKLWPGSSGEQKQRLAEQITQDVMTILNMGEKSISVAIEDVKPEDWAEHVYDPDIASKRDTIFKPPGYERSDLPRRATGGG